MIDVTAAPPGATAARRPRRLAVLTAVAAVIAVAAAGTVVHRVMSSCRYGTDLTSIGGQCIGTTDGSFVFDDRLGPVEKLIAAENARVRADADRNGTPYVRIGLLTPLTADRTSAMTIERIRYSLEGAYLAQRRANTTREVQDPVPQIELVLASEGNHQQHWRYTVGRLEALSSDAEHPLLAVAGLAVSIGPTYDAARTLSERHIPAVSVATATSLNFPGLMKASASNDASVEALARAAGSRAERWHAALVYDKTGDPYADTIRAAFEHSGPLGPRIALRQDFTGSENPRGATPNLFFPIGQNICVAKPRIDVVYFAGRIADLAGFADSLAGRPCATGQPITVLAVAAGLSGRGEPYVERLRQGGVTILSAAASDHETWNAWPQTAPRGYREFLAAYRKQRFDDAGLPDGYALKHADAVTVAVKAIRSAGTATGTVVPKLADVFEQAGRLNGVNAVPAYSGRLEFVSGGNGWPGGRPVPVLRTPPEPRPAAGTTREYLTTAG